MMTEKCSFNLMGCGGSGIPSLFQKWIKKYSSSIYNARLLDAIALGLGPRQDGLRLAFLVASRTLPAGSMV